LPFQSATLLGHTILALAILLRLGTRMTIPAHLRGGIVSTLQAYAYDLYKTMLAFDAVLMCVELFTFMWISMSFGVLTIIMGQMMVDLRNFVVFAIVLVIGFTVGLLGLSETSWEGLTLLRSARPGAGAAADSASRMLRGTHAQHTDSDEPRLPLMAVPLWAMFTDLDISQLIPIPVALPLMLAYVLLANVVLVNLLIAMFAHTYSRVMKDAAVEFHSQRFMHIFEYIHVVHPLPPPFSIPWIICGGGGDKDPARALFRIANERPSLQHGESTAASKKFVQAYLKEESDGAANPTRKLENMVASLEERLGQQLERLDVQLGGHSAMGYSDEELRSAIGSLVSRLDRSSVSADPYARIVARAPGHTPHRSLFSAMVGAGSRL
jgi:hypothetical protein